MQNPSYNFINISLCTHQKCKEEYFTFYVPACRRRSVIVVVVVVVAGIVPIVVP